MPQIIIEVTDAQLALVKKESEKWMNPEHITVLNPLEWLKTLIEQEIKQTDVFVGNMFDEGGNSLGDVLEEDKIGSLIKSRVLSVPVDEDLIELLNEELSEDLERFDGNYETWAEQALSSPSKNVARLLSMVREYHRDEVNVAIEAHIKSLEPK